MSRRGEAVCVIGVATNTYRGLDAPEPLTMWADIIAAAAADSGGSNVLAAIDSLTTTYCQTWQYDDPISRLATELAIEPRHGHYHAIGGTSGQQLVDLAARRIRAGESDVVAISSAEALATQAAARKRGERRSYRYKPEVRRPYPFEAPLHPAELAHDLLSALNSFALFDSARRAHLGVGLDDYRDVLGHLFAPMTAVAAANLDAWFRVQRSANDIAEPRADNRMTAYPYTKFMVAVMDVDMAAGMIVASESAADRLGVPQDRRVYLHGSAYLTDPTYIAEHQVLHRSPAMAAAARAALLQAGMGVDAVAYLDLYSCFGSSLLFACDALGIEPTDARGLTVTGGLPYHGGPGSGYMVHSIAGMVRRLRDDPGSFGMVSGVGMINTKHTFAIYGTAGNADHRADPDLARLQAELDAANGTIPIREGITGVGTILATTVVHGRDSAPTHGIAVIELVDGSGRAYARLVDADAMAAAESRELVGSTVEIEPHPFTGPMGETTGHVARLR